MHWYSGSIHTLREAIDMGCYFSLNQQMLLSKNGRGIIDCIPIERILIESDAPFSKGLENEYSMFFNEKICEYLTRARKLSQDDVLRIIKNNFRMVLS